MKKTFLYILLAINLLGGCKNSIDRNHQITFDKQNAKSISESEIFARSKIIQLEDHERGFFSPDSKITFENDCFYVVDNLGSQSVIQFNSNGKFLRSIGTQGKGPTEFTTLSDAIVTEKGVEILDGQNTRILSFDMFGKFHSSKEYMKKPCIAFEKCE
ncbi:MAG: 6-bladed beta-propeller, partial [Bacteroidales bacterium]|nr:6-bladed beta-propeller [Bacteroidales bacterium]